MQVGSDDSPITAGEALSGALAEAGWLIAVVVVAIFFNTDTARIFEEDKVQLLRSIALVVALGWIVWVLEGRRWTYLRSVWRRPTVKPVLALAGAYLVSVPFSIAPRVSFWGAYDRAQGAYTWICYAAIFVAIVSALRRRDQLERLVVTILIASLPLSLYGIVQRLGADPIEWVMESFPRVHSMAGNSIFLGAALVMVIPLTLGSLLSRWGQFRRGDRARHVPMLFAYLSLLLVQLLAVLYSGSRGPFLGLCAGLAVFLLAFAACTGRRCIALSTVAATSIGVTFLVVLNLPNSALEPLRKVEYIGRLGEFGTKTIWSSTRVRMLVWESVVDLLEEEPGRLVFGYGPDTLRFVFPRVRREEMSYNEDRDVVADRAHNETLDALVMTGVVGLVAEIVFFVSLFFWVTRWLGLLRSRPQRVVFLSLLFVCSSIACIGVLAIDGNLRFLGVALPLGMVAGLSIYLAAASIGRFAQDTELDSDRMLLIAVLAAVVGHLVEIQFGIATVTTRLYLLVFAALALLAGERREFGDEQTTNEPADGAGLVELAPVVGMVLVLLTFDFYRVALDLEQHGIALGVLCAAPWIFGVLLVTCDHRAAGSLLARVTSFGTTSLGLWVLFLAVYLPRASIGSASVAGHGVEQVVAMAATPIRATTILYVFTLAAMLAYAGTAFLGRTSSAGHSVRVGKGRWIAYAVASVLVGWTVVYTNLRRSWADVHAAHGERYEAADAWANAARAYSEAERMVPDQDIYTSEVGFTLLEQAKRTRDWEARQRLLRESEKALLRAQRLNPVNLDHARNLAKLHRSWSVYDPDPEGARRHFAEAESRYRQLSVALSRNAGLMNEWATLYLDHGDMETALARLDDSLRIDDRYETTYWLRGSILMKMGAFDEAVAAFDQTIRMDRRVYAAESAKTLALVSLGRLDEAIRVSQQSVDRYPEDLISRRNLILLLQQTGERERALENARAALEYAEGDDAIPFRELIAQLEESGEPQGSGEGSPEP